jgi:hypothetical protein
VRVLKAERAGDVRVQEAEAAEDVGVREPGGRSAAGEGLEVLVRVAGLGLPAEVAGLAGVPAVRAEPSEVPRTCES